MPLMRESSKYLDWLVKSGKIERTKFILKNGQSPGDILMLTACIRDIKRWYPHLQIDVRTSCDDLFHNSPYITKLDPVNDPDVYELDARYEMIHQSNQNIRNHFLHGFIEDFNEQTGYMVKLTEFKADVHLTDEEANTKVLDNQPEKFVVINAGGKKDYKTKWWWTEAWKEVVALCPDIQFVQVGIVHPDHVHEPIDLPNCVNAVGKTDNRQLLRLIYQSVGTVSVVTAVMHMAAAFDKHAAVIAGGHEPWWWEKYPNQNYFHTIGALNCCREGGCWSGECRNKNAKGRQKCLELIRPIDIANAVKSWF